MAAPQLRLEVSLNLLGFRSEIQKLTNIAQSEFTPKINVKFNRRTLDAELNNLQAAIKRRTYRIEIGGNIDKLPGKIQALKKQLASLESFKIDLGIGAVQSLSKRDASKIKSDLRAEILGGRRKIYVPVSIKPSIARQDVRDFKNAVQSQLTGLSVKVKADLEAASISSGAKSRSDIEADVRRGLEAISEIGAQRMSGGGGGVADAARREQLRQSLATGGFNAGSLRDIGKQLGVAGVGRLKNVNNLINKIVAESSIEMVKKYLDPQAVMRNSDRSGLAKVLDTFARGVFNMLGMDPASIRAQQQSSKQKAFTPAGLLPSFTLKGAREEMMRQLTGGISPSAAGGGGRDGKLAVTNASNMEVQPVKVREIFDPREFQFATLRLFKVIGDALESASNQAESASKQAKNARIDESVDALMQSIDNAVKVAQAKVRNVSNLLSGRADVRDLGRSNLLRGVNTAGLLPPAVGRAPSPYSTTQDFFARRTEEAQARSRQRALAVSSEILTPRLPGTVFSGDAFTAGGGLDRVTGTGQSPQRGGAIVRHPGGPQLGAATRLPSDYFDKGSTTDKYREGLKLAEAATNSFRGSQIPLIGGLRGIAGEFGEATKQVLLYGTAYKALAFVTSLPGQILNATKSQQQFTNGLQTATQNTGTFAKELLYVDNVQRAFGLNLETTRRGFIRLFASMAPTGFDSGSIEKLFTGISAATASLQLSPEQADRVTYAFGQMASKGQIMSEELKGQLGDVLPGALSIFADAAGMSIKEFSKAMENGEFVGNRFREVFAKVSDELMNRFGTGAQAAARSLQGLINTVGGDFRRTLESFGPLANSAAESILKPLGAAFRQLSVAARLATGERGRLSGQVTQQEGLVQDLRGEADLGGPDAAKAEEQYKGAKQALEALKIELENFNELAKDPAVIEQAKNIKAFTDEIGKAGNFVKNFAMDIGGVLSPVLNFLGTNLTSVIGVVASLTLAFQGTRLALLALAGVMIAVKGVVGTLGFLRLALELKSFSAALAASGATGKAVAAVYTFLGIGAKAVGTNMIFAAGATIKLTTALAVLGGVATLGIIAAIGLIGAAFAAMGQDANQAAEDAKQAAKDMAEAARTGNVFQVEAKTREASAKVQLIEDAEKIVQQRSTKKKGAYGAAPTPTLSEGDLSDADRNVLAAVGISLPKQGVVKRDLEEQLNDLKATAKGVLKNADSQMEIAKKQQERTGQSIPGLLPSTEPAKDPDAEKAAQRGANLLNAIEQREEAIADARKQREESIASIRKNAAEEFTRMEEALADRRLKIEREIVDVKRKSADTLEDIQRQIRIARGEDSDIVGDEQKVADISRRERDANLEITQRIADEEKEQARNIAAFQQKVAKDIQSANEAHTKRMGEIQQGYAKQVAKIIDEGTGKAGKQMVKAGELAAQYIERASLSQARASAILPDGSALPIIPRPKAFGQDLVYPNLTPEEVPDQFKRIDRRIIELERSFQLSRRPSDIGGQFTALLGAEGGFEDIAGLEPLPIQKMYQQIGRPFTQLYKQIERMSQEAHSYSRGEIKKLLAPDPKRTQTVLKRAERVETTRQTWQPLEAQSKELLNRTNPAPRSKPSQASLETFEGIVRSLSKTVFTRLNSMPVNIDGILGDISDYLEEGEREVLRKGIADQLKQGVSPSSMPIGGNINTGRAHLRQAVTGITAELLGTPKTMPRGPASTERPQLNRQLTLPLGGDSEWLQRYFEQTEPPRLNHGFSGMEGASLPGAGFDTTKVATDFGTIVAASILRGVLDVSRIPDASRSAQIAQAYNVPQSQQTSPAGAPYDATLGTPEAIRATEARGRLQSTVQDTGAAMTAESLELLYVQITEDSAKASAEMTKQISLIKKQAALIRSGINSELAAEFVQLDANYNKEVDRIKARKLAVAVEELLIKEAENLRDTLKAQTKERILQSKILAGEQAIEKLKEEIKLLLIINDEERKLAEIKAEYGEERAQEVFDLVKIKENIEATRALIGDFVSSTASDYKGFLKAVISGEDAVDALKQFQEGLTDKVLTIFLDFAMAPVEKFMKEAFEGLFLPKAENIPGLDIAKEATKDPVEATNSNTNATNTNTTELKNLTTAIQGMATGANATSAIQGPTAGNAFSLGGTLPPIAADFDAASVFGNPEALTGAFGGVQTSISESMNGIVSSFENGASSLGNALPAWDTALATNIPDALKTATNDTNKAVPTFQESLGKVTAGIGIAAGAIMGIAAGISQIKEGGTSNVLGGIGSVLMSLGGAVGGFAGFFKGANGGVAGGGWKPFPVTAFANGGMVNGPTLGLVGEGKYNEAIVPLPDGRSIPVQMQGGGGGLREAMSGGNGRASGSPILNMSFQSTNINGVEYVSRDQLEAAMATTRRQAAKDGANRGMSMTLDKLQQSPSTRSRLGMGGR